MPNFLTVSRFPIGLLMLGSCAFGLTCVPVIGEDAYADRRDAARAAVPLTGPQLTARLKQIRSTVESSEQEIESLKAQYAVLLKQRKESEAALQKLKDEERRLERDITELDRKHEALSVAVERARAAAEARRSQIAGRLRAMYMNAGSSGESAVLWRASKGDLERTAVYIKAVRSYDSARFEEVRIAFDKVRGAQDELDASIKAQRDVQGELKVKREGAQAEALRLKGVVDQINAKKRTAEKALSSLRSEADRLENLLASITRGDADVEIETPSPGVSPTSKTESPVQGETKDSPRNLAMTGLFSAGVKLVAPVKGKVVQRFGNVRVTNFSDMMFSKGIEYSAPNSTEVHAVSNGRVAYLGDMPGFGTVVVLDHGQRSYSLYGRLGAALVSTGQTVAQDAVIGSVSAPDEKGRAFYFEVRKSGTPVDPSTVLKKISR